VSRICNVSISVNTLNILADKIEKSMNDIQNENGKGHNSSQAATTLNEVCVFLRNYSSGSSIDKKSTASCGNSK